MSSVPPGQVPFHIGGVSDLVLIGQGGFGAVYRGHQLDLGGRDIAIKVLRGDFDATARLRFEREGAAVARLGGHPNIVEVYFTGSTDEGQPFLAMEYLAAGSVADRMGSGAPIDVAALGLQLCDALSEAHRSGIIHRDIKPRNILIGRTGLYKLADFGIAALHDGQELTGSDAFIGDPGYAAPETIETSTADERSDIYSLGVTLASLSLGRQLFVRPGERISALNLMRRVVDDAPLDLAEQGVEPHLALVLERLIARNPGARPSTAAEARAMLGSIAQPDTTTVIARTGARPPTGTPAFGAIDNDATVIGSRTRLMPATPGAPQTVSTPPNRRAAIIGSRWRAAAYVAAAVALLGAVAYTLVGRGNGQRAGASGSTVPTAATVSSTSPTSPTTTITPQTSAAASTSPSAVAELATTLAPPRSTSVLPATTLTTAAATATVPSTTGSPPPESLALTLARQYADALALHAWSQARALNPKLADDATLDKGYQYLHGQIVVDAIEAPGSNNVTDLRLLILADEAPPSGLQTSFWCFHWKVDSVQHTVASVDGKRLQTYPGTMGASATPAALVDACRQIALR